MEVTVLNMRAPCFYPDRRMEYTTELNFNHEAKCHNPLRDYGITSMPCLGTLGAIRYRYCTLRGLTHD